MRRSPFLFGLLGALLAGCAQQAPEQPFTALAPDAGALKTLFNAERGKVRVLMLVSPT
jgi:hypothetical protein